MALGAGIRTGTEQGCRPHLKPTNKSYRIDETYINVKGEDKYLYRALDSTGQTIESPSPPNFATKPPLAYEHVADLLAERDVEVDPSRIWRWVPVYAPEMNKRCRPHYTATREVSSPAHQALESDPSRMWTTLLMIAALYAVEKLARERGLRGEELRVLRQQGARRSWSGTCLSDEDPSGTVAEERGGAGRGLYPEELHGADRYQRGLGPGDRQ